MRRYKIAELLLQSVVPRVQAAGIVGDTAELYEHNAFAFWLQIARVLIAFSWWPTLVFCLTLPVGFLVGFWVEVRAVRHFVYVDIPQPLLLLEVVRLQILNGSLWGLAAFSLLRYGPRERAWVISASLAMLLTGFTVSLWNLSFRPPMVIGSLLFMGWIIFRREYRLPAALLAVSAGVGSAIQLAAQQLLSSSIQHHISSEWFLLTVLPLVVATPFTPVCYALLRRRTPLNTPRILA